MTKNDDNRYVPSIDIPIDDYSNMTLHDIFAKRKALQYLKNPKKYLQQTEIINFSIIRAEIEKAGKEELAALQRKAEKVELSHFDHYENERRVVVFKGTLKWRKKNKDKSVIDDETKKFMKDLIIEHNRNKCGNRWMC